MVIKHFGTIEVAVKKHCGENDLCDYTKHDRILILEKENHPDEDDPDKVKDQVILRVVRGYDTGDQACRNNIQCKKYYQ